MSATSKWLNGKFFDWQRAEGGRRTITDFAAYLGVSQASLSEWLRGKYDPKGQNISRIAEKLGYEIYDALGMSRPLPEGMDEQITKLVSAASQFPAEVQTQVIAAFQDLVPILAGSQITDPDQIMLMMADELRKRISPNCNPDKLAAAITGIPRSVYPIGIGFSFERTTENIQRFKATGVEAARIIDSMGLDEDSEQGQAVILQTFLDAGFPLLDSSSIN
jgi:transcriptional regulator with XRE-family HTH domain